GLGTGGVGILASAVGSLNIQNFIVRDFAGTAGIWLNSSNSATFYISDTLISGNLHDGIQIGTPSGTGIYIAVLNKITVVNNFQGIDVLGFSTLPNSMKMNVVVTDSIILHNNFSGITTQAPEITMVVRNSVVVNN